MRGEEGKVRRGRGNEGMRLNEGNGLNEKPNG